MTKEKKKAGPKQGRLPGMNDPKLADLEDAAYDYVEIRDRRMALMEQEVPAKARVLAAMHKHGKKTYRCDELEIQLVEEAENVKVRIVKEKPPKKEKAKAKAAAA